MNFFLSLTCLLIIVIIGIVTSSWQAATCLIRSYVACLAGVFSEFMGKTRLVQHLTERWVAACAHARRSLSIICIYLL